MIPQHVYTSVPFTLARQIRLLSILPPKSHQDEPLSVRLQLGSLSDEYIALSYCWGDENMRAPCLINDVPATITASLAAALYQFRAEGRTRGSCVFWIDAICINQFDEVEKESQVKIMSDIYTRARSTTLWLGESADNSDTAMDFLADVDVFGQKHFERYSTNDSSPVWQALHSFLRRPWWSRLWIIQEAMLSKEPLIKCGAKEVSFGKLVHLRSLYESNLEPISSQFLLLTELWNDCPFAYLLSDDRQRWIGQGLSTWITDVGPFQCKHLRDKLYGLLGLMSSEAKEMVLGCDIVTYDKKATPDRAVVIGAARVCLYEVGLLTLQIRQIDKDPDLKLPSWTPDWTSTDSHVPMIGYGFTAFTRDHNFALPGSDRWVHPELHPNPIIYKSDHEALIFHGFKVDLVDFVSVMPTVSVVRGQTAEEMADTRKQRAELTRNTCRSWEAEVLMNKPNSYSCTGQEGCVEAFCRTIIWNSNWDKGRITSAAKPFFDAWQERDLPPDTMSVSDTERNAYIQDYRSCTIIRCARRSFITTKKGYFGLAPANTRIGDYVCLLYTGQVAYILRPNPVGVDLPGKYIGEAYVHGIMNGEYLKESNMPTWSEFWVN